MSGLKVWHLICPHCECSNDAYHMDWTSLKCDGCGELVEQKEWTDVFEKEEQAKPDMVNSPPHYNVQGPDGIECIDAIRASMSNKEFCAYLKGSIMKYLWRHEHKHNPLEDLNKAQWFMNKLRDHVEG